MYIGFVSFTSYNRFLFTNMLIVAPVSNITVGLYNRVPVKMKQKRQNRQDLPGCDVNQRNL